MECVSTFISNWATDDSTRMFYHKRHIFRSNCLSSDNEVTFIFAIFVIYYYDKLSCCYGINRFSDRIQFRHATYSTSKLVSLFVESWRSTYFARISTSILTEPPAIFCPRLVADHVWGITATSKRPELTAATVRLIPSIAMEPLWQTYCSHSGLSSKANR